MIEKVKILLRKKLKKYQEFHAITKQESFLRNNPTSSILPKGRTTIYYKEYPRLDKIVLPDPHPYNKTIFSVLSQRKSTQGFSKKQLTLEEISNLLFYSAGERNSSEPHFSRRFYPSAGALYPLEIYILSLNTELSQGTYHYNVKSHSLEILSQKILSFKESIFNYKWIFTAAMFIVMTGVFQRNVIKYGDRGYRHILVEAGHVAQNFYLNAAAENIAISSIGGYRDDDLNKMLDVDGIEESAIYVLAIGSF